MASAEKDMQTLYPKGDSKTYPIHVPGGSSDECKFLGDFGNNYAKKRPTKDRGNDTVPRNKFKRQQENTAIVNSSVDEILMHENGNVSAMKEEHENVGSDFDEN